MGQTIYADFNATTPLCSSALEQMLIAQDNWGNPSSAHRIGRKANELLETSRDAVARACGVESREIVFTSGGSEANTLALLGSQLSYRDGFRLLTSRVEHSSVRDTVDLLQEQGATIQFVKILANGELEWDHFEALVREFRPHLVSLMAANNESGVIYPIPRIAALCAALGIVSHTDAVQAFGKVDPPHWNVADLISISAHKIHGPKGAGALIVRRGRKIVPTHYGGSQEIKRRGGTENTVGIAGFSGACRELPSPSVIEQIRKLRDHFETTILENLDNVSILGAGAERIANTSNIRFHHIPSEILLGALDLEGVAVSAGSACSSGSISPSHVLVEMGLSKKEARECLRISWGRSSSLEEVDTAARLVINHVRRIRLRRKEYESAR